MPLLLKRILLALAALVLVAIVGIVAIFAWFYFSSLRAWDQSKAALAARNESVDLKTFLPAPIPDSENFFADPFWAELADLAPSEDRSTLAPRLPKEQRALDRGLPPLTAEEITAVNRRFPSLGFDRTERYDLARSLWMSKKPTDITYESASPVILEILRPAAPLLQHIADLTQRPDGLFPITRHANYPSISLDHLNYLMRLAQIYNIRAKASLLTGDTTSALADTTVTLRLSTYLSREPILISQLVRISLIGIALNAFDFGLVRHLWTDDQLQIFEATLRPFDLPHDIPFILRGERASMNRIFNRIRTEPRYLDDLYQAQKKAQEFGAPLGVTPRILLAPLMSQSISGVNRITQQWLDLIAADPSGPRLADLPESFILNLASNTFSGVANSLAMHSLAPMRSAAEKFFLTQTQINQTRLAIALERYRLAHGSYPDTLDALVPAYLPSLPPDLLADAPMRYALKLPSEFLLYSVGLNLTDDSGTPGIRPKDGDLVWGVEPPKR